MRLTNFVKKTARSPRQAARSIARAAQRLYREQAFRRWAHRHPRELSHGEFFQNFPSDRSDPRFLRDPFSSLPCFFINPAERSAVIEVLTALNPDLGSRAIDRAERIVRHEFDLLGSGPTDLGETIDWHRDFKSGFRWEPGTYFRDYIILRSDSSDVKVTRELSRFQHLVPLGQAYWHSGDERYAIEFVSQLNSWMSENPPMFSINWECPMDVAIRAVNWIWGLYFFCDAPALDAEFKLRLAKSLMMHGRFIFNNLEYYEEPRHGRVERLNSNHYLSNLAGLVFIASVCPDFRESAQWLECARRELLLELEAQVYPSGVDYEHSLAYHRLVLELFLFPLLLLKINGRAVPDQAWQRLERMFEFLLYYTKPDGTVPLVGDADDGRLVVLSNSDLHSHRYLLSLGALLFRRSDMKQSAGAMDEVCVWTLGPRCRVEYGELVQTGSTLGSKAFQDAKFFVLRRDPAFLFVDAADIGLRGSGSHDHNDRLSFELFYRTSTFFSDSGTYVYSADPHARNRFRSTRAHNTVQVDDTEQNRLRSESLFTLGNEALTQVLHWSPGPEEDQLTVAHLGYHRLNDPVTHCREFHFQKEDASWRITDRLTGNRRHHLDWFFHLGIGIVPVWNHSTLLECLYRGLPLRDDQGTSLILELTGRLEGLQAELVDDWISQSYGRKAPAKTVHLQLEAQLPVELSFHIHARTSD